MGSFNEDTNPTLSANDVSVTNTTISAVGGGDGFVEGGGFFASADLNATGLQVLDTSVTSDDEVLGGVLADDDEPTAAVEPDELDLRPHDGQRDGRGHRRRECSCSTPPISPTSRWTRTRRSGRRRRALTPWPWAPPR